MWRVHNSSSWIPRLRPLHRYREILWTRILPPKVQYKTNHFFRKFYLFLSNSWFKPSFQFKTYNPEFTQIEIWFRFIFMLFAFIVLCWYAHTLRKYSIYDWSIEQKWIGVLLPLVLLYDSGFFIINFFKFNH